MIMETFDMKIVTMLSVMLCVCAGVEPMSAQWVQTSGPFGGSTACFAARGAKIFVGTKSSGVFSSSDSGATWLRCSDGLTNKFVNALVAKESFLIVGSRDGVFISGNDGLSWTPMNKGLTKTYIRSIAVSGSAIYAGSSGGGLFRSINGGKQWAPVDFGVSNASVLVVSVIDSTIFVGTTGGLYRSADQGQTWRADTLGLTDKNVYSIYKSAGTLLAGTGGTIFRSLDDGKGWTAMKTVSGVTIICPFIQIGTKIFTGGSAGVLVSGDTGITWDRVSYAEPTSLDAVFSFGGMLFAGTSSGVYTSSDLGVTWKMAGFRNNAVRSLFATDSTILAGTLYGGVHRSQNKGNAWTPVNTGLLSLSAGEFALAGSTLYCALLNNEINRGGGVYSSVDQGSTWKNPWCNIP